VVRVVCSHRHNSTKIAKKLKSLADIPQGFLFDNYFVNENPELTNCRFDAGA
jgi:hypothetical protein